MNSTIRFENSYLPEWIDQILEIHNKTEMKRGLDRREMINEAFSSSHVVVTAWLNTRLVACGRMISDGKMYSGIFDVVVDPEFQKQGIGQQIMERLIAKAPHTCIHLTSTFGNETFYAKLGFKKHKTAMALYPGAMASNSYLEQLVNPANDEKRERHFPELNTDRLHIRLPLIGDISRILRYFVENEAHLSPFDPKKPEGFYTENFWKDRIPKHHEDFKNDKGVRFYFFHKETGEICGSAELSQISRGPFQACYLGYGIAQRYQGTGLMYEALVAIIKYAFDDLNIHRIMANHLPENERSARVLRRLGFLKECVAKNYLKINGEWRDHVLNSLTNENWREK